MPRARKPPIKLTGMDSFLAGYRKAAGVVSDKEVAGIMLAGARVIAKAVRRRAPKGPTGNLKKGVRAKKFRRFKVHQPAAWAGTIHKLAPHAHLVEYGHRLVRGGQEVGFVRGHPFFRPAVQETRDQVKAVVTKGLARGLQSIKAKRRPKK